MTTDTRATWQKVQEIIAHQMTVLLEREDLIPCVWSNRIAQQHLVMIGGPGSGKTMVARNTFEHIVADRPPFEATLDETSDPGVLFGPTDVKAIAEGLGQRRLIEGMLPEAYDALVDEIMNANGPTLRSMQPVLNERLFHQGRLTIEANLRSLLAGTNLWNMDERLNAVRDRLHQRHFVEPIRDREKQMQMAAQAVERLDKVGRGKATEVSKNLATVTIEELDDAHHAALQIPMSDRVIEAFFDLREELADVGGVTVSDRRTQDGMVATLATAWVRGHDEVTIGDMDVLQHMWWDDPDQRLEARRIILGVANPGDKFAMDAFDDLKDLRKAYKDMQGLTGSAQNNEGVEISKDLGQLIAGAQAKLTEAHEQGWPTEKLDRLIAQADDLVHEIKTTVYGIGAPGSLALTGVQPRF